MSKEAKSTSQVIGYFLLTPPLASIIIFFIELFSNGQLKLFKSLKYSIWTGDFSDGGGFMSALPVYFGLMAIAGAYLIKDK